MIQNARNLTREKTGMSSLGEGIN